MPNPPQKLFLLLEGPDVSLSSYGTSEVGVVRNVYLERLVSFKSENLARVT